MPRVRLIHWQSREAEERAQRLRAAGFEAESGVPEGPGFVRELEKHPPAAVVIDLSRLPSQGRDLALMIRRRKAVRHIPLVFVGGDPEKVARIKKLLPDAVYTCWGGVGGSVKEAIAHSPAEPVVPRSVFEAYAGKPLVAKLGIKAGSAVAMVGAPGGFRQALGELPEGVQVHEETHSGCDLTIWFTRSGEELRRGIEKMMGGADRRPLWIVWPKKASSVATDLSQQYVREVGLAAGLVDYRICSIDDMWSGLLFTRRKSKA
jgi:hypothetical protein